MKHGGRLLACMLGGIALTTASAVTTDAPDSPYQEIINRNVFALKPPPPPPNPEDTKPPPSKITLTGITTIVGKKALMKTPPPPVRPGNPPGTPPPTEQFYMLAEGQRDGEIEVLAIDEIAGSVKVRNSGIEVTLTFEKDGVKLPATVAPPAPAAMPGMLPAHGGVIPPPAPFNPAGTAAKPEFPVRPMRAPNQSGVGNPGVSGFAGGVQPAGLAGGMAMPGFGVSAPPQSAQIPQNTMPLEEQIIGIEAQRQLTQNQVLSGRLPPLPPTPLTPAGSPGSVASAPEENQGSGSHIPALPPLPGRGVFPGFPPPPTGR